MEQKHLKIQPFYLKIKYLFPFDRCVLQPERAGRLYSETFPEAEISGKPPVSGICRYGEYGQNSFKIYLAACCASRKPLVLIQNQRLFAVPPVKDRRFRLPVGSQDKRIG
jgi:hypothetical protein